MMHPGDQLRSLMSKNPRKESPIVAHLSSTLRTLHLHRRLVLSLFIAVGLVLTPAAGTKAQDADLPTVTIGSKDFTEQIIVSEMLAVLLEDAGYTVDRVLNLGGSAIVHTALADGEIDAYVEYTGTGLLAILGLEIPEVDADAVSTVEGTPPAGGGLAETVYEIVRTEYQEQFDLVWLEPWGFNNTYTLAMRADDVEEMGLETISDLEGIAGDLIFGATQEFVVRPDGLPGLTEAYGFEFGNAVGMDPGLVYSALDNGDVDVISAFATDGRIPALNLVTLEDDLGFFPPYFAAPVVRQELLDASPEIAEIFNQLAGLIDDQTMADLNFRVDEGGEEPLDVATSFLEEQGLIGS
jgi:glycine betaine/choline ABC-type transport system substrate-binding protein